MRGETRLLNTSRLAALATAEEANLKLVTGMRLENRSSASDVTCVVVIT